MLCSVCSASPNPRIQRNFSRTLFYEPRHNSRSHRHMPMVPCSRLRTNLGSDPDMARFTVQSMLRQAYKYRSMGSSGYLIARPSNFRGNTIPSAGCSHVFLSLRSRSLKQIRVLRWPDRALLVRQRRRINASINSASPAILPANVT